MDTSVYYSIKSKYKILSKKEKLIADYIIDKPLDPISTSISKLSSKVGVSEPTMVRFVRKLGFQNYQQFRIILAREIVPVDRKPLKKGLDSIDIAFNALKTSIEETSNNIDRGAVQRVGKLINDCEKFYIFGMGGSSLVAEDLFHRFIGTGICCQFSPEFHTQLTLSAQSCEKDLAIIISFTGIDLDAISIAQELKNQNCPVVVLTAHEQSPITEFAQELLVVHNSNPSLVVETFAERMIALAIIDALYIEVAANESRTYDTQIKKTKDIVASRRI